MNYNVESLHADIRLLQGLFRTRKWYSEMTIFNLDLKLRVEVLEDLGLIEGEDTFRRGYGYRPGRRLFEVWEDWVEQRTAKSISDVGKLEPNQNQTANECKNIQSETNGGNPVIDAP